MVYSVIIQQTAILDALDYAGWIKQRSGTTPADRWLFELQVLIDSLADMPTRFRAIDEQDDFNIPLRQVPYHSHRVIYHVNEEMQTVHVLRIYPGAEKALTEADVPPPGP